MAEVVVARVKSLYGEIKGYYNGLPQNASGPYCVPAIVGQNFNNALDELTRVSDSDYSRFKISAEELNRGQSCNLRVFSAQMSAVISKLQYEYNFDNENKDNSPNIVILNKNTNEVSISVDYTVDDLISQNGGEAAEKLKTLKGELGKKERNWDVIKSSLIWILNFSKELFLKVLPILLEKKI